jgi:hypothetical protein
VDGAGEHQQTLADRAQQNNCSGRYGRPSQPTGLARISAGRRAFSLTISITQRDAPSRRSRGGVTGLEVVVGEVPVGAAGERRGRSGMISPDQARPMRQMSMFRCRVKRALHASARPTRRSVAAMRMRSSLSRL